MPPCFQDLERALRDSRVHRIFGRVRTLSDGLVTVEGLENHLKLGDRVNLINHAGDTVGAEAVELGQTTARVFAEDRLGGFAPGDRVELLGGGSISPDSSWMGQALNAFGTPLDGGALRSGDTPYALRRDAPPAIARGALGARFCTGLSALDTFLPLVRGQRTGVFAGSGVGKTTLLAQLARSVTADVIVLVLIGERGREVRDFIERDIGPKAMGRCIVVAATSDQSPALKRRAAWTGLTIAEYFRDLGAHALLLFDSLTRFAQAHRDIVAAHGEPAGPTGFPPSTAQLLSELIERTGPGAEGKGDISAIYSVLVAGSDMEEPLADTVRGMLDGHIILSRDIATRGRYPAIDVLQSVSRALPGAASDAENDLLTHARRVLSRFEDSRLLIEAGLYTPGADEDLDRAVALQPELEALIGAVGQPSVEASFERLRRILA